MKKLEISQMEQIQGEGWGCWVGFGAVTVVGVCVIASVASGGALLPVMLTAGGKFAAASMTAAGLGAMDDC
jgi:hypothetical protein